MSDQQTDFGYSKVSPREKTQRVAGVFQSVADNYDLMNDLMSLGIHRLWKRFAVELSGVAEGDRVLDLAGGTGDLSIALAARAGETGQIILSDINGAMLSIGRDRIVDTGLIRQIGVAQINAEQLPFADNYFDCITIGFGLRNVTDKQKALRAMSAALKPGGRLLVLEFSKPTSGLLSKLYDLYSFNVLPKLGEAISGDAKSYQYLAESIRMHPNQKALKDLIERSGFDRCEYYNLSGGIVALHRAFKC
ncbi:MAG TPA: bifunctional demethylmenaquinone methyltransferase/2-methoxy-6-polyprenyl-1,4-benzoquinol methylase UbiE [Chromatiaceae bacterium]|nr:bifunctional demethylmenaquinone methyltransferase/2-methoxy-6-polyprenyl-1,4-benzoquinol methylase UbiE [Chromatiaceae bacterium]HIN81588.1 bifunctional demethylmenaquinone methyltransferase/2-methoxy-6-polyprenyl-1,4-benzoquinol methylase UbiE [Chromatiales bacterium]HIA08626.1 bifunctional demethylmenaquinone methyltransferase/2-methoxy-6-polyprenyl-1,4-benzoquinol methylase UbiE [Chromatiaceae bacterium]HIB84798.1 bifunctional demethylmenaquinone methyltransferase/2-methoxy-6-polyprenyl-1